MTSAERCEEVGRTVECDVYLNESDHTYWLGEEEIPGVTDVITDARLVNHEWATDFARDRGSEVHKAIHYWLEGDLDLDTLPEMYQGYLAAARRAIDELELEVIASEQRVFHPVYRYAGTADLIARRAEGVVMIDFKTAFDPPPATALQVAAYAEAWQHMTGEEVSDQWSIGLSSEGRYRLHNYPLRVPEFDSFLAALSIYNLKKRYGL